jgi:pentatricopeptide repeat protein
MSIYIYIYQFDIIYIFDQFKSQLQLSSSVITWTAMIQAYRIHEQLNDAWQLFQEMENFGIVPTEHTFSAVLSVIGEMTNIGEGQKIHQQLKVHKRGNKCVKAYLN